MGYIALGASLIAVFALIKWLLQYISTMAIVWYLTEKGFPLPSDEDMEAGTRYVLRHLLSDLRSNRS